MVIASCCSPATGQAFAVGDPNKPIDLYAEIVKAAASGAASIRVNPGVYRLPSGKEPDPTAGEYWRFTGLHDLTINASGVTLLFQDFHKGWLTFSDCRNVVFQGAQMLNETPPDTQGTIVAIGSDADGVYYDVQIDSGYLDDLDNPVDFPTTIVCHVFDAHTRLWKAGTWDFGFSKVERIGPPRLWRCHCTVAAQPPVWNVAVGDLVVGRANGGIAVHLLGCTSMTLSGLTIQNGGTFGFVEDLGGANHYLHDTITYGPIPAGGSVRPLLSENADGFHSTTTNPGPDVEHCLFEGMADDGIAIYGYFSRLVANNGVDLTVQAYEDAYGFKPGDQLFIHDHASGFVGSGIIRGVQIVDFNPAAKARYDWFDSITRKYCRLTMDRPIAAPLESLVSDSQLNGSGYRLVDNRIRNNRARGMYLRADNGVVTGNLVDGSTQAGIVLSPEEWNNSMLCAGYSHHVQIIGNTVRNTGYADTVPSYPYGAAVTIAGDGVIGHDDITIANNTISDVLGANLEVSDASNVKIVDNTFVNTHRKPVGNGAVTGLDPNTVIWLADCKGVRLMGNNVDGLGRYATSMLSMSPTAIDVTGARSGIRARRP